MGYQAKARFLCLRSCFNQLYLNELYRKTEGAEYSQYLGLNNKFLKDKFLKYIYIYGILLAYPGYVLYKYLKSLLCRVRCKKVILTPNTYYLLTSIALPRVARNAKILDKSGFWIELPWKNTVNEQNKIDVFDIVTSVELLKSCLNSVSVFYISFLKYGLSQCFLQLHSFEWFLYFYATQHIPYNSNVVFCSHLDKWTVLLDHIHCQNRILVQHGTEIIKHNPYQIESPYYKYSKEFSIWHLNPPYKYQYLNSVYSFSKIELVALNKSILKCKPQDTYIVGYGTVLQKNESQIPIILIIGFYREYFKQEKIIIEASQNLGYRIILKNHPTVNANLYSSLKEYLDFDVLNGDIYPDADIVFSYDSTLALQYEDLGKKVFYYADIEMTIDGIQNLIRTDE